MGFLPSIGAQGDRNGDISKIGVPYLIGCNQNVSLDSPYSTRTYGSQTPLNIDSSTSSSNHRSSLEKDVYLLQSRLQQEKSMRNMLEKAIGRASSALSPGHRHFASQTKELIAEIELLEEEVANREQHVLSLYRNIFEQCVSQPSSVQTSGMSSPAHKKNKARKHPSIISSAFCSSKKFPLRALSLKSTSAKKDGKLRHSPLCTGKVDIHFEKPCSNQTKFQVRGKSPDTVKNSGLRTLKDYLHQCPSKLSEEMVKCMAAVYCWLCSESSTKSEKSRNNQSSVVSRSCADRAPQLGSQKNQYSKSMIEISSMPTDKKQISRASYAISSYRTLVEQLERVNVSHMEAEAQIAFWINIHNSLIMHAYLAYGIPHSSLRRLALFHKAAYNIGGIVVTANAIEHTIFCFRTPRIGGWVETFLSTAFRKKSGDEKQLLSSKISLPDSQPLVSFALCTGAFSDPVLKVYTAANVRSELEQAKMEFLQTNIVVKKSKVFLPKMLERFSREASMGSDELLKWVGENVDRKLQDSIQLCLDSKNCKKASQIIEWLQYSSKFRYAFSGKLASKPWWV
ncbi:uncharacterized protein LOC104892760 isoform X3 [Beta vulgaris subsp. vulgaris]|uniref:uncharacterized protein LOC104892760 isoform X3 n=1 Tax=Beta vulgaris subsp. vulgaris TaxID=3555 RepID=UPI00203717E2|nr:uncharacterized protein LOC104892760 isoform X3 [Beta vulgaris subsp. vulgaris]